MGQADVMANKLKADVLSFTQVVWVDRKEKKLKFLSLAKNPDLKSLPDSLADLENLEVINIKDSPNVEIGPRLQEKDDNEEIIIIR